MPISSTKRMERSAQLLSVLEEYEQFVVVMHDNPDPDAIAAGWGVYSLIEDRLNRPVRLIAGGDIVRAENRHMVELLTPPIELVDTLDLGDHTATILVDCGVGTNNQWLTRAAVNPVAVIDHHDSDMRRAIGLPFHDIRPYVAASASIVASYLREQSVEPGVKLATAMVYAVRTETRGSETYYSQLDRTIVPWLTERADPSLLAEIENAPLSRAYFSDLVLAIQNTFLYDDAALCLLPRAQGSETVGEIADLLIRCHGIRKVLCGAVIGRDLLLSVRTEKDGENATRLLLSTINGLGSAGGHARRAGGKIANVGRNGQAADAVEDDLRGRWLSACHIDRQRGTRLVAKREIVENL